MNKNFLRVAFDPARRLSFSILAALGSVVSVPCGHAQIIADPTAPGTQRPTVLTAPNGVPLVNIQTPSAAGVSRNTYRQFDVQQQGAILNNSRTNPWLATGSARVILNEVNSSNPSQLRGYVEVAGQRAQVVVANPAGIHCEGCGFINANRTTLTTGIPILNGGRLDGHLVQRGAISIGGAGMDTSSSDYTDLIARAVQINAGLWAQQLTVTTGHNQVSVDNQQAFPLAPPTDSGPAPSFAIDVAALGGMYAGKIILVGTEAGVGVRNAGHIGAGAGEVIVSANGWLDNRGRITSAGSTSIDARAGIVNNGTIYSQGDASLATQGNIDHGGQIAATGHTTIAASGASSRITAPAGSLLAAGLDTEGHLSGTGRLQANATETISAHGQLFAAGDASLVAAAIDLSDSQGSARDLTLAAHAGDIDASRSRLVADQRFIANAAATLRTDAAQVSAGELQLQVHHLSNVQGELLQTGPLDLSLELPGTLDNAGGSIATGGALHLAAGKLFNKQGQITAGQTLDLKTNERFDNSAGLLAGKGDVTLQAADVLNQGGTIGAVEGQLRIHSTSGVLDNTTGRIQAARGLDVTALGLVNTAGTLTGHDLQLDSRGQELNNRGGTVAASRDLRIDSGRLDNETGTLSAEGSFTLDTHGATLVNTQSGDRAGISAGGALSVASGALDNRGGFIGAEGRLLLTAGEIDNRQQGLLSSAQGIELHATGLDNQGGQVHAAGDLTLTLATGAAPSRVDNTGGLLRAGQALSMSASRLVNRDSLGEEQGIEGASIRLAAHEIDNARGALRANEQLLITSAGQLDNSEGLVSAGQVLRIEDAALAVDPSASRTLRITNARGTLIAGTENQGQLGIDAATLSGDGQLLSHGGLTLALDQAYTHSGKLLARGDARLHVRETLTNSGNLQAGGTLELQARSIDNQANGEISGRDTRLRAEESLVNRGLIDGYNTRIDAPAVSNLGGGRIYGNHIAIQAGALRNDVEGSQSATIAARERLDIGATTVLNREQSLIFSGGELAIGGSLDENGRATGSAQLVHNASATIESLGDMRIAADELRNSNEHFAYEMGSPVSTGRRIAHVVGGREYRSDEVLLSRNDKDGQDQWLRTVQDSQFQVTDPSRPPREAFGEVDDKFLLLPSERYPFDKFGPAGGLDEVPRPAYQGGYTYLNGDSEVYVPAHYDLPTSSSLWALFGVTAPDSDPPPVPQQPFCLSDDTACQAERQPFEAWAARNQARYEALNAELAAFKADVESRRVKDWTWLDIETTRQDPRVTSSAPARILAGGNARLDGRVINDNSQILVGATLSNKLAAAGAHPVENHETQAQAVLQASGTAVSTYDCRDKRCYLPTPYFSEERERAPLSIGDVREGAAIAGTGTTIDARTGVVVNQGAGTAGAAQGGARAGGIIEIISQVPVPGAPGASTVVRVTPPNLALPTASLFRQNPTPGSHVLIETDPRFANYRQWLSSDYLLEALALDPAATQKRLGDGFHEQRLVREQVAQLTGHRLLEGYASDEEQYGALMNAGVTYAQQFQLRPGVALTAEQMAQLTSDIVWLVEQEVTLADPEANKSGINGASAGVGYESGSQTSTTRSGISGGAIVITDEEKQRALTGQGAEATVAALNRDVTSDKDGNTSLSKQWDGEQLKEQVQAGAEITAVFGQRAAKAVGDYAQAQEKALIEQAGQETDPTRQNELLAEAEKWGEGGVYRVAAHTAVGALAGGMPGALGAGTSAAAVKELGDAIDALGLPEPLRQALIAAAGTTVGAVTGGATGATTAFNQTVNNYLNHDQMKRLRADLAACKGDHACIRERVQYWERIERQQSEEARKCPTSRQCVKKADEARSGNKPSDAPAQDDKMLCNGEASCLSFVVGMDGLERRNTNDEITARDNAKAVPVAKARERLIEAGMNPDAADIAAGITPADIAGVAAGAGGIAKGNIGRNGASKPDATSNAKPDEAMLGANGVQVASKTVWRGTGKERIDVENPNPGQRPGQIHYQDNNGGKYLYDPASNSFPDAPNSVNKLLLNSEFSSAIRKATDKYLGVSK